MAAFGTLSTEKTHKDPTGINFKLLPTHYRFNPKSHFRGHHAVFALHEVKALCDDIVDEEQRLEKLIEIVKLELAQHWRGTTGHSYCVGEMCEKIANELERRGLITHREALEAQAAGFLHDLGKFCLPMWLLFKETTLGEPLTMKERKLMALHPEWGSAIFAQVLGDDFPNLACAIRHHHERWDGKRSKGVGLGGGYPDGLKGEKIPMVSRIIMVADTFDALTNKRPQREKDDVWVVYSKGEAAFIISEEASFQFDPKVVGAFLTIVPVADSLKDYATKDKHQIH